MSTISKKELVHSFRGNNTKRRDALYAYYKEWFYLPLTAGMLAQRISDDLGIPVGESIIYHIRSKFKPEPNKASRALPPTQTVLGPKAPETVSMAISDFDDQRFNKPSIQFLQDKNL